MQQKKLEEWVWAQTNQNNKKLNKMQSGKLKEKKSNKKNNRRHKFRLFIEKI